MISVKKMNDLSKVSCLFNLKRNIHFENLYSVLIAYACKWCSGIIHTNHYIQSVAITDFSNFLIYVLM